MEPIAISGSLSVTLIKDTVDKLKDRTGNGPLGIIVSSEQHFRCLAVLKECNMKDVVVTVVIGLPKDTWILYNNTLALYSCM